MMGVQLTQELAKEFCDLLPALVSMQWMFAGLGPIVEIDRPAAR